MASKKVYLIILNASKHCLDKLAMSRTVQVVQLSSHILEDECCGPHNHNLDLGLWPAIKHPPVTHSSPSG